MNKINVKLNLNSLMNKNYDIENTIIVTDWMQKPDLFPIDNNFDKILKGFLETAGRISQPSYNFYVIISHKQHPLKSILHHKICFI